MKDSLTIIFAFVLCGALTSCAIPTQRQHDIDERSQDYLGANSLQLPAPIKRWDNAIPLGNGSTGGLLWGEGRELLLSLDRGDLWDERGNANVYADQRTFATLFEAYQQRDRDTWSAYFDRTYFDSPWTKIPGGRLVITLPEGKESRIFKLDFEKATGRVEFTDGTQAQVFFSATRPVAMLRLPKGASFNLVRPSSIDSLNYPAPEFSQSSHELAYSQKTAESFHYAFDVQWQDSGDYTVAVIAITSSNDAENPLDLARQYSSAALREGWNSLHTEHLAWWNELYNSSTVTIPESRLQHHYNLVKYFYGSGSRAHASPMPLQGVWTADTEELPPWKGDYHNDLNTQMTYVAWQAAGLTDPGMSYLNYYWDRLPQFRQYGKNFFESDGAMVPGVMTHNGQAMGGWPQYSMSLTMGLWNGHAFYQYWKTSGDNEFLRSRAYPWLSEVANSVFSLTTEKDGRLLLPLSSSPEWNNNAWDAYLEPNSNFDQALLLWASQALEEMAIELQMPEEAEKWAAISAKLAPLEFDSETGALLIAEDIAFEDSHRHFSHTLAIHPLGILNVEQSEQARQAVQASVRELIDNGSNAWVGYSFTWAASLAARAGYPDDAVRLLSDFERAFVTRNGFHVNGDQIDAGLSDFDYRPFTLEGNFLFMDAIHEMYLQSWGGRVRIFPALPDAWQSASFTDLRAEGGFKVTAEHIQGRTQSVEITSVAGSALVLRDPFNNKPSQWTHGFDRRGQWLHFKLGKGETLAGKLIVE